MAKCKVCKEKFAAKYFLQKTCVEPYCLAKWAKDKREKITKKQHTADKKRLNDNDKPLRSREAQKAFNAYIRARDADFPCISCGRFHTGQYHAGHYKSRGAHPELRFNELNCHKQCSACNNHLSGNIANYRPMLAIKIGLVRLKFIEGPHETKKYTCAELKEIELLYKEKLKELQ